MLSKKVVELLNDQVNKEFYSAYLYLDMSNTIRMKVLTALQTGIKCRHRKRETMQCCSWTICSRMEKL